MIFPRRFLFILMVLSLTMNGIADEGMWMPHQMKDLNLKAKGLQLDPAALYKTDGTGLMSAVVKLKGATGEFVSPEGLILTNHHVAFSVIQRASDKEHDYITHGFLAKDKTMEIEASGYYADVLLGYDDVSAIIQKKLKRYKTPSQRVKALDIIKKKMIAKVEKNGIDIRCSIKSMYSGNQYYLFKYKRLLDVRIVYAPPRSLGNFGGEIDNWMWPRHTADFTFLRAYVSKDNTGVAFSKNNVPYKPKSHFKISLDPLKDGDFTFLMGYPGTTYRNFTTAQFQEEVGRMQLRKDLYKGIIHFIEEAGKDDRGIAIKYASLLKGVHNGYKNYTGKLEGFAKHGILAKKKAKENAFIKWIEQDLQRKKKYGDCVVKANDFVNQNLAFFTKKRRIEGMVSDYRGPALLSQAHLIYRIVKENQRPDIKREEDFQKRDLPQNKLTIKLAERRYLPDVDRAYFAYLLKTMLKLDKSAYPKAFAAILEKGEKGIDRYVANLYANTILKDPVKRLELITMTPASLLKLNDPFITLAAEIEKELKVMRLKDKLLALQENELTKVYKAGLLEMTNGQFAPDANSSIRFTYGPIKGYFPKDAVTYLPFSTLKGVMEKDTGKTPFDVPAKLKELYSTRDFGKYADKKTGNMVTCFLNTTNVTGGNSGSAVLNAKGEQIGIIFDMTYESVIGDYLILPKLQRSVGVDIRYVLFITEKFSGAHHLIKEMRL
jgi:Peptidase S46